MTDTLRSQTNRDVQRAERRSLLAGLAQFQGPSRWRSIFQFSSTALAYVATVAAMYAALKISVWLTLAMSIVAAGLVVRLFIIQHDCGHGSYFRSPRANEFLGLVLQRRDVHALRQLAAPARRSPCRVEQS